MYPTSPPFRSGSKTRCGTGIWSHTGELTFHWHEEYTGYKSSDNRKSRRNGVMVDRIPRSDIHPLPLNAVTTTPRPRTRTFSLVKPSGIRTRRLAGNQAIRPFDVQQKVKCKTDFPLTCNKKDGNHVFELMIGAASWQTVAFFTLLRKPGSDVSSEPIGW